MKKIARRTGISRESVRPSFLQAQTNAISHRGKHVSAVRKIEEAAEDSSNSTLWAEPVSDENLFSVEQAYKRQNDLIWSTASPGKSSIVQRSQILKSVKIWAGICATNKPPFILIDSGVKINKCGHREEILEDVLLTRTQRHFKEVSLDVSGTFCVFWSIKMRTGLVTGIFPDYNLVQEWPRCSCDLNRLNFFYCRFWR